MAYLVKVDESFFCQKSMVTWLKDGDRNTGYFHRMAATRQSLNHIYYLIDNNEARVDKQQNIINHCVEFFQSLRGSEEALTLFYQDDITNLLQFRCLLEQQENLTTEFTNEKIKAAFFSLPRNKACGLDGFFVEFLTVCWTVVGAEVTLAIT